jgi:hypothetical protein
MGGAALLALAAPASAQEEVELPAWMAGCWEMRDGERWADECWMSPRGGVMLGAGRSGSSAETTSWEAMQIIIADRVAAGDGAIPKMTFWASPDGQSRTPFVWSPHERDGVTFFNLANDYPQRVHYWRDGALLKAEISMADGSKPMRWTFAPAGGE